MANIEKWPSYLSVKKLGKIWSIIWWVSLATYLALTSPDKKPESPIPSVDFLWKEIVVKSKKSDWQKYIKDLTQILAHDNPEKEKNLQTQFFEALIEHESAWWQSNATSKTGARGLGQLTSIVFDDMHLHHRKWLFQKRFIEIFQQNPSLLNPLPKAVKETLENFIQNENDENWAIFVSRLKFYAYGAKNSDPHTNLILCAIYYDLIYDSLKKENIEEVYQIQRNKTDNTPYALPKVVNYGDYMKRNIAASRRYNGSTTIVDWKYNIEERDRYPKKVIKIFIKNNFSKENKKSLK